jgi:hypothetical protein
MVVEKPMGCPQGLFVLHIKTKFEFKVVDNPKFWSGFPQMVVEIKHVAFY